MSKQVILTGLRTNAGYHLGNYLGAILPMDRWQQEHLGEYQVNMFAPDRHSFTGDTDHTSLHDQTMNNLKVFVAAGMPIDNPDFYMYRQSFVPAHSELTVILNNFAYFGELNRMTQFKDKSQTSDILDLLESKHDVIRPLVDKMLTEGTSNQLSFDVIKPLLDLIDELLNRETKYENTTAGLFDYPVLMAADILLYGAKYVPLGDDQKQHLELTRDLGIRMNNKFGDLFTIPEEWKKQLEFSHRLEGVRIRSLRNPQKKMSKSVDDPNGTIQLTDTPEEASKKVKSAETDSVGVINWDWDKQPGITNLLQIYELLSGKSHEDVLTEWTGRERYGDLKTATAEQVSLFLTTFQANLAQVDSSRLLAKLEESESAMNDAANQTLLKVQKAVGLR